MNIPICAQVIATRGAKARMGLRVVIVGAGLVGLCTALSLRERGHEVLLLDRQAPLERASRWNAGVLATSSLWPMVNPELPRQAPFLLFGHSPGFRLNTASLGAALPFALRALRAAKRPGFEAGVAALGELIALSRRRHDALMAATGTTALRTDNGWLHLYETEAGFEASATQRSAFERNGCRYTVLDRAGLGELEPHLAPRFERAVLFEDSAWVSEPADLGAAYLARFRDLGGEVRRAEASALEPGGPAIRLRDGERLAADRIVVAAGPWSGTLLARSGLRLPMIAERGYVRRVAPAGNAGLGRPVFDTAGGIVLAPRPDGVQITTGTELCRPDAPRRTEQAQAALERARLVMPLEDEAPAAEAAERPTLPDSLPAIGPLARTPAIWLATGHQHIGFSTSAGTGELVADGMTGSPLPDWAAPFSPARFGL